MSAATNRGTILSVAAALVLLFVFTTILNSAYRATRQSLADSRYRRGLSLAQSGRQQQAVEEFSAALTYSHGDSRYRLALVRSLIDLGRWNEAATHLQELSEDDPTDGEVNFLRARIAARDRRDSEAVTYFNRAIYGYWSDHADENRLAARFELVGVLEHAGQEKQVLAELLQLADECPPDNVAGRLRIAHLLLAHGSPDHAAEVYRGVLASAPKQSAALEGLGEAEFAMGDFRAARGSWRAALRLEPGSPALERRIVVCEAVLDLDPTQVHLRAGQRFERAQEVLRRTLNASRQCAAMAGELASSAEAALAENPARRRDGDTLAIISLAQQIWKARTSSCTPPAEADAALDAVMAKLQKQ